MTVMVFEIQKRKTGTFHPISFDDYVVRHLAANKDEKEADFRERLRDAIEAKRAGRRCDCEEPMWAIGSAETGYSCFACTTGESHPPEDYEIDTATDLARPPRKAQSMLSEIVRAAKAGAGTKALPPLGEPTRQRRFAALPRPPRNIKP